MPRFQNFNELTTWCDNALKTKDLSDAARLKALQYLSQLLNQLSINFTVPIFTITGTNGKGSTVHTLQKILTAHGLKVASFTSPHLLSYTERVMLDGIPVTESQFLEVANTLINHIQPPLAFFDFLLLMALFIFKQQQPDIILLEVGIGGRLDATNVLDADVVILTSIDLDHTQILGHSRESIGYEKIALLRPGKILVCGDDNPPANLKKQAQQVTVQSYWLNKNFGYYVHDNTFEVWLPNAMLAQLPKPSLIPSNVACAMMTINSYFGKNFLQYDKLLIALNTLTLPGRCQIFNYNGYEIILDVAHNPAAVAQLSEVIKKLPVKSCYAIVGMMQDKDLANNLNLLSPLISEWWLCNINETSRAASATQLASYLENPSVITHTAIDVLNAWQAIQNQHPNGCRVIIFGSFRTVAPMLNWLQHHVTAC